MSQQDKVSQPKPSARRSGPYYARGPFSICQGISGPSHMPYTFVCWGERAEVGVCWFWTLLGFSDHDMETLLGLPHEVVRLPALDEKLKGNFLMPRKT